MSLENDACIEYCGKIQAEFCIEHRLTICPAALKSYKVKHEWKI